MAAVTGGASAHATLTSTTADTVTLATKHQFVRVVNRDATTLLYVRVDGVTAVAEADETFVVLAASSRRLRAPAALSIVGNANPYSVEIDD